MTAFTSLFTAGVCAILAFQSWAFVSLSREFEDQLLGGLPAWAFQIVLPVAFALITARYLIHAIQQLKKPPGGAPL